VNSCPLASGAREAPPLVEAIVLWSFSRFARNLLDAQFYKADLRRRGFQIISMTDDLPGGDLDAIVEALYDWKHEQYLKDLSLNVKRTLHELARQGYSVGGFPPRGYKVQKVRIGTKRNGKPHHVSQWIPDPEWAPKVELAFRLRSEGASFSEGEALVEMLAGMDGLPMTWAMEGQRLRERMTFVGEGVYSQSYQQHRALIEWPWKYIATAHIEEGPKFELFNLEEDPQERRNLAREDPERTLKMAHTLAGTHWRETNFVRPDTAEAWEHQYREVLGVTKEEAAVVVDRLRALGYAD